MQSATLADLQRSGLTPKTIEAAGIRDEDDPLARQLFEQHDVRGYLIPYYDTSGKTSKHFRVKRLGASDDKVKYWQPKNSGQHVYVPPQSMMPADWVEDTSVPLLITEGEKKALAGAQAGFPTLGLGGVWSWRRRFVELDKSRLRQVEGKLILHLNKDGSEKIVTTIAPELEEIAWHEREVTIIFDTDERPNDDVDEAAFSLSDWLAQRGAIPWRYFLEATSEGVKTGLDDFLIEFDLTREDLERERVFPVPTFPKKWINEQLAGKRVDRETVLRVARVAYGTLNQWGTFYHDEQAAYYYFDRDTRALHRFEVDPTKWRESTFGVLVVRELGVGYGDAAVAGRVGDLILANSEPTSPRRVLAPGPGAVYYQLSDGTMAKVGASGVTFHDNGHDGVLFLADSVEPLDPSDLDPKAKLQGRWYDILDRMRLEPLAGLDRESTVELLATLFYISPWLNRWNGLMAPMEIAVAEPGSGKTGLYNLRKGILTGRPQLASLPDDFRSWAASVADAGPLWVCDNLGSQSGDYWHRLTDEITRLLTDPEPTLELRRLYTTSSVSRLPVHTAFAITTIRNPFTQPDLLQRSLVMQFNAIPVEERDPNWYSRELADRPAWVSEHLGALQAFLRRASKEWKGDRVGGYRLPHVEQALLIMGRVFGIDLKETVEALSAASASTVAQYDPVLEAFIAFVREWHIPKGTKHIRLQEVVDFVQGDPENRFSALRTFNNSITLGKYVGAHKYDLEQATGLSVERHSSITYLVRGDDE